MTVPVNVHIQNDIIDKVKRVLLRDKRVLFAYLYGSAISGNDVNDIDIAIYTHQDQNPHVLASDLKIELYRATTLSPDIFDVRVINGILENGDLFGLLYLKNIFLENRVLVDRAPAVRADLIERYGWKFRECQGLIQEVVS